MSLYNNVEQAILKKSGISGRKSSPSGLIDAGVDSLGMGAFGSAVAGVAGNVAMNAGTKLAQNMADKFVPANVQKGLKAAGGMVSDYLKDGEDGGLGGVGLGLMDAYGSKIPGQSAVASQAKYWKRKIPLWGGITPVEAAKIYDDMQAYQHNFAKKNLFLVQVDSALKGDSISHQFNLFVTEIDYAPFTLTGEKRRVGSASVDIVQSSEPVEMRITTLDDKNGSVKKWFVAHHAAAANADGTVGVPADYAIQFKVVHSHILANQVWSMMDESGAGGNGLAPNEKAKAISNYYEDIGQYRPANLEISLSRREDGLQEIQMTFSQLDTFMTFSKTASV